MAHATDDMPETIGQRLRRKARAYLMDDIQLKLLALLIVTVIWVSVADQARPVAPITIPNVDVEFVNMPPQLAVTSSSESQVKIRVQGPDEVLRELRIAASTRSGDLVAVADLSAYREGGVQIAPLEVRGLPDGVTLREVDPPTVRITLDPLATEMVKVQPRLVGSVPDGYKLTRAYVVPEYVTIRGPKGVLDDIDDVATTTVSLSNRTESFEQPVEIDITGADITVEDSVVIHVQIEEDYGTREFTVPVTSSAGGQVDPPTVTVRLRGPFPALNQIQPSDITAVAVPSGDGARQTLAPQIQVAGPAAPRVEVESVRPQQVRWRR